MTLGQRYKRTRDKNAEGVIADPRQEGFERGLLHGLFCLNQLAAEVEDRAEKATDENHHSLAGVLWELRDRILKETKVEGGFNFPETTGPI